MLTAADVATAAQLACLLEASAPKPGNVSPGRHFHDARYEDFLASAAAVRPALGAAHERPLGATVRLAVEATGRWARSNTNLGVVLLLAPLARAALLAARPPDAPAHEAPGGLPSDSPNEMPDESLDESPGRALVELPNDVRDAGRAAPDASAPLAPPALRAALGRVLAATTVDDARDVYAAIRRARPGGLGRVSQEDVAGEPTVTLLDAMRLAAGRDGVAREYATGFETTFALGAPALERARAAGLAWDDAVVETFLTLLAARPDTHVERRAGAAAAAAVSHHARRALDAGGVRTARGRRLVASMDRALRGARGGRPTGPDAKPGINPGINPGTTADLTAAAIFVVLLGGGWRPTHGGIDAATR